MKEKWKGNILLPYQLFGAEKLTLFVMWRKSEWIKEKFQTVQVRVKTLENGLVRFGSLGSTQKYESDFWIEAYWECIFGPLSLQIWKYLINPNDQFEQSAPIQQLRKR